jgi:hypothetical protein
MFVLSSANASTKIVLEEDEYEKTKNDVTVTVDMYDEKEEKYKERDKASRSDME